MKTLAAVLVELGRPLELADLEVPLLAPGQVLVQVAFSGVCATQLGEARGLRGPNAYLPHCLGHEAGGTVVEVGPAVTKVRVGNRVILSWMKGSGIDVPGTTYRWGDRTVNAGGVTTFATYTVVAENRLTPIDAAFPLREAALLGCAAPTGLGAVFNTAAAERGASVVVFGTGGIGLCAVAAARIAGLGPIVAVDPSADRLQAAERMGATQRINPRELGDDVDIAAALKKIAPQGFDYAIEASGVPDVMSQALAAVRNRGGTAVLVGNAPHGRKLEIDPKQFNLGKRLLGTWGGDNVPDRDFPRYCEMVGDGRLSLAPLMEHEYALTDVNRALEDLERGTVVRPLLNMAVA
ncbi:MAG: zinc-binding dehydrogenase [Planctomycetia bacterium]|nr:zinc-binding dehydrogenase [Planctomycetia bacterium]